MQKSTTFEICHVVYLSLLTSMAMYLNDITDTLQINVTLIPH